MWFWVIVASDELSTKTPMRRSFSPGHGENVYGPLIVKPLTSTSFELSMWTRAWSGVVVAGNLIVAWRFFWAWSLRPSLSVMRTCSWYRPGQTSILSPGAAASTAAWMLVIVVAHCAPSSSTLIVLAAAG